MDDAVIRRLVKRIYVPLPDTEARYGLFERLVGNAGGQHNADLGDEEMAQLVASTDGYSASDITALCKEAAMGPVRDIGVDMLRNAAVQDVRPMVLRDFQAALRIIRASVSKEALELCAKWSEEFGTPG